MSRKITLRSAGPDDEPFLYRVYASTREDELKITGWDDAQKAAFLEMQHRAQHTYYHEQFSDAQFLIISADDEPIGRYYVLRNADELHIIDIALLPAWRNAGIGGGLIRAFLAEASEAGKPVRIHVERFNPAFRLYDRLGFRAIADGPVYCLMEWTPGEARDVSPAEVACGRERNDHGTPV